MTYLPTRWRILRTPPPDRGAWNMAVDEAILEASARGEVLPTLRLYAWEPACLSLGFSQPVADADRARLVANGWELVRRPTGGRAILHTDELTYAVIGPQTEAHLAGSVLESYQRLSKALLSALNLLGIPATSLEKPISSQTEANQNPICFEIPSNYEITVNGKKLIGSAQARRREGVLQHGSLPLHGDLSRITRVLSYTDESYRASAAERLLERATTIEAILGYRIPWSAAAEAFQAAFREVLGLELIPDDLTPAEKARVVELMSEKYDHPAWTERV